VILPLGEIIQCR
jgi:ribonuclease HI